MLTQHLLLLLHHGSRQPQPQRLCTADSAWVGVCRYSRYYIYNCAPTDVTDPWGYSLPAGCEDPDVVRPDVQGVILWSEVVVHHPLGIALPLTAGAAMRMSTALLATQGPGTGQGPISLVSSLPCQLASTGMA